MRWLAPFLPSTWATLVFLILIAILFVVLRYLGLGLEFFHTNGPALSGMQSFATIVAIAIGSVLAYLRFFAHRVFVQRASVEATVAVHGKDATSRWHVIEMRIENEGTIVLLIAGVEWECVHYHAGGSTSAGKGNTIFMPQDAGGRRHVIDSGETDRIMMVPHAVPRQVVMSAYRVALVDISGRRWVGYCSTANSEIPNSASPTVKRQRKRK